MPDPATVIRYVTKKFPTLGRNKRQEVIRLVYEIAKREKRGVREILAAAPSSARRFARLKEYLVERRFPHLKNKQVAGLLCLPALKINPAERVQLGKSFSLRPKQLFIEESVLETDLSKRILKKFPGLRPKIIPSYKDFIKERKFTVKDYNHRRENWFLVRECFDFLMDCPCTPKAIPCGYHILNIGYGCPLECTYCFLQSYTNSPGIVLPANVEGFFAHLKKQPLPARLGTGQFTDSLVLNPITEYSTRIIDFFRKHPESTFEFKTKTDHIDLLLRTKPPGNIVVSWSLNPQKVIETNEFYTASLDERLEAARKCATAGYKVGFHFDPIIYYKSWENDYQEIIDRIFTSFNDEQIAWISLGTLRMTPRQKTVIENRFPANAILDEEFFVGYDGKLRYASDARTDIYRKMFSWIRRCSKNVVVYLCMEEKATYEACEMLLPRGNNKIFLK